MLFQNAIFDLTSCFFLWFDTAGHLPPSMVYYIHIFCSLYIENRFYQYCLFRWFSNAYSNAIQQRDPSLLDFYFRSVRKNFNVSRVRYFKGNRCNRDLYLSRKKFVREVVIARRRNVRSVMNRVVIVWKHYLPAFSFVSPSRILAIYSLQFTVYRSMQYYWRKQQNGFYLRVKTFSFDLCINIINDI